MITMTVMQDGVINSNKDLVCVQITTALPPIGKYYLFFSHKVKVLTLSINQKPCSVDGSQCVDQSVSINFTVADHVSRSVPKFVAQFLDHLVTWWKLLMMSTLTKRCSGDKSLIFKTAQCVDILKK